jgi:hypothetical protein
MGNRTRFSVLALAVLLAAILCTTARAGDDTQFSIYLDTDEPGSDYKRVDPPSFSSCQDRCAAKTACRAFTYDVTERVCFLKTKGDIPLIFHSEAISGEKIAGNQFAISKKSGRPRVRL